MVAIVTGSAGLIGAESVRYLHSKGMDVIGIDNDMRAEFFGAEASTAWSRDLLKKELPNYQHLSYDIRNFSEIETIFKKYNQHIDLIIHAAAQPSHDWAAKDPMIDYTVNANGTLNLLELTKNYSPNATFIYVSTNKVYGDRPNSLSLIETPKRWEVSSANSQYQNGIDECFPIDQSTHSLFGVSKLSADLMVQEYGRYFGLKTVCFRGGCLTGPGHSSVPLHGFLSYITKCAFDGRKYTINGYKGKQVRDNIHSSDLVTAFWSYYENPRGGQVYNIGGGRGNDISILEAIDVLQELTQKQFNYDYSTSSRIGDHIWYISDLGKFQSHYPSWQQKYSLIDTITEIYEGFKKRARA
jgi:CDP-paratose 2-epimerase